MGNAARRKKRSEFIRTAHRYHISPCNKKRKKNNYYRSADETQFFADDGKDKVVLRFRNIKIFLAGISKSRAPKPAGTNCYKGLYSLESAFVVIGIRIEPDLDTVTGICHELRKNNDKRNAGRTDTEQGAEITEFCSAEPHHRNSESADDDSTGKMAAQNNEQRNNSEANPEGSNSIFEGLHFIRVRCCKMGKKNNYREFCNFGRLERKASDIDPSCETILVAHKNIRNQKKRNRTGKKKKRIFLEYFIVYLGNEKHCRNADNSKEKGPLSISARLLIMEWGKVLTIIGVKPLMVRSL